MGLLVGVVMLVLARISHTSAVHYVLDRHCDNLDWLITRCYRIVSSEISHLRTMGFLTPLQASPGRGWVQKKTKANRPLDLELHNITLIQILLAKVSHKDSPDPKDGG